VLQLRDEGARRRRRRRLLGRGRACAGRSAGAPAGLTPPASPLLPHQGFTAEVNLGVGFGYFVGGGVAGTSDVGLAGVDVGVGGWITPSLALTFRVAGVSIGQSDTSDAFAQEFIGPSLQRWLTPHAWASGRLGLADGSCGFADFSSSCAMAGVGATSRSASRCRSRRGFTAPTGTAAW
jgi:hypothetical protein